MLEDFKYQVNLTSPQISPSDYFHYQVVLTTFSRVMNTQLTVTVACFVFFCLFSWQILSLYFIGVSENLQFKRSVNNGCLQSGMYGVFVCYAKTT